MPVRKIIRMGHPTLRQLSRELSAEELRSPELARLVDDMVDTLHDYGGIGLAAPQIDEPVRLAIIEVAGGPSRYGDIPELPLSVFVNPRIEVLNPELEGYWEGCLSVPGLRGFVRRPQHIQISAVDMDGESISLELNGFLATVFQHEFDHLDGKLYVDRIDDPALLAFEEEFERYILEPQRGEAATEEP
jgi:peptide deformylase